MPPLIDLDANATTRPLPEVIETVARCLQDCPGNPGSRHGLGRKARQVLETSRETIAAILGAHPEEVHFTSGGTEANNLAISGLARGPARTILLSPGEHPSNLEACRALAQRGWSLSMLSVDANGFIVESGQHPDSRVARPESSKGVASVEETTPFPGPQGVPPQLIRWPDIGLAAVILAHNETGVIQDVSSLANSCLEHDAPLHLDGVQAVGKISVNFHELQVTSLSLGAHKFHGPRGIGALMIRRGTKLTPLFHGGHQEHQRRPGTEPVALIAGMAKALELWHSNEQQRTRHLRELRDRLQTRLTERAAPVMVHALNAPRLPNTLNIAFPGLDGEALLVALDLEGVCCSLGSTCASGSMEPAPILLAMGVPAEIAKASVRFSVSALNTLEEMDEAARRIAGVATRLRKLIPKLE